MDNYSILLVCDDFPGAAGIEEILKKNGFQIMRAASGEEAIEVLNSSPDISLIIMDSARVDGLDGPEWARRMLSARDIPLVFMSTNADMDHTAGVEGITSYGFFHINGGAAALTASIRTALQLFQTQKQLIETGKRLKEKEKLRVSEENHRQLFETMSQGVIYQSSDGAIISANPAAERILGLSLDQMLGKTSMDPRWKMINKDGTPVSGEDHPAMEALRTGKAVGPVVKGVFHPGKNSHIWLTITAIPLFHPGETAPYQAYATIEEITERKQAEDQIAALLREKEILLKETHHRIKNNMTVITSMLSLQASMHTDSDLEAALDNAANRVRTMMVLYDKLYRTGNTQEMNVKYYLPDLIREILDQFSGMVPVRTDIALEDVVLDSKTLPSIGIIINELITNSMKYAFEGISEPRIRVNLSRKQDLIRLLYADNGTGLPESVSPGKSSGFGLQLLDMTVGQIGGSMEIWRKSGTSFVIRFPV